jgi:hypothetical protein
MQQIDLTELTRDEVTILAGQPRGLAAREHFDLLSLDQSAAPVAVLVPDNLEAITASFFQGMFAESVAKFNNAARFLSHYRFDVSPELMEDIMDGINKSLMPRDMLKTAH